MAKKPKSNVRERQDFYSFRSWKAAADAEGYSFSHFWGATDAYDESIEPSIKVGAWNGEHMSPNGGERYGWLMVTKK